MNNQEAFNCAVTHLLKQGRQSVYFGTCKYRHPESGERCAIGALIPDDSYDELMEGRLVGTVIHRYEGVANALVNVDMALLRELQTAHDYPTGGMVSNWPADFRRVGEKFGLDVSVVETTPFAPVERFSLVPATTQQSGDE